jgi:hypothetical protein
MARRTAESLQELYIWDLTEAFLSISVTPPGDSSMPLAVPMRYTRTSCHFGGTRLWFLCAGCNRRVGALYFGSEGLKCRHCYQLTYASRKMNRQSYSWQVLHAMKLRDKAFALGEKVTRPVRKGEYTRQVRKALKTADRYSSLVNAMKLEE